jgi:hypothetical protein
MAMYARSAALVHDSVLLHPLWGIPADMSMTTERATQCSPLSSAVRNKCLLAGRVESVIYPRRTAATLVY